MIAFKVIAGLLLVVLYFLFIGKFLGKQLDDDWR